MYKRSLITLNILLITSIVFTQNIPKDTIYGRVKKIKEKVIFLSEVENPQLIYYDDYGHSGFMGPETTITRFFNTWYSSDNCYYLNYEVSFNENRNKIKEIWFGKKNDFINSYRYLYDKKDRLISTIDSSDYSCSTRNHYFEEWGNQIQENIIYNNLKSNIFSHFYRLYENGKVIKTKNFDDNGIVYENLRNYNEYGKLVFSTYKNPNSWKKLEDNNWSFGIQDSTGTTYKSLINEYDTNNRLIKTRMFDLDQYINHKNPIEINQTNYIYLNDNLITKIMGNKEKSKIYYNFRYDKNNRMVEKYCCDKDITKSNNILKYTYSNDKIIQLNYSEMSFSLENQKMINYIISFSYKYDKNNNWIEIIKTVDGKDLYKWVRKLDYYRK